MGDEDKPKLTKSGIVALTGPLRWLILQAILIFSAAGHTNIPRARFYLGIGFIGTFVSSIILYKYSKELMNQRGKIGEGTKSWDKFCLAGIFIPAIFLFPIIAGLDLGRYKWSFLGKNYLILGILIYIISFIVTIWAMLKNKHFEAMVRIQKDRNHKVITDGPYQYIRHPGYLGMILLFTSYPMLIGSSYAFIPMFLSIISLFVRTYWEDNTLSEELEGYKVYREKVQYRLIPKIW